MITFIQAIGCRFNMSKRINYPAAIELIRDPRLLLAFGFGSGLSRIMPGTCGTLAALPIYFLMSSLPWFVYAVLTVLAFFVGFSLLGMALAITAYSLFSGLNILPDPSTIGDSNANLKQTPFAIKIYGVLTSALMISIYAGVIFGGALKRLDLGQQADAISDLFIKGFRKFLIYNSACCLRLCHLGA